MDYFLGRWKEDKFCIRENTVLPRRPSRQLHLPKITNEILSFIHEDFQEGKCLAPCENQDFQVCVNHVDRNVVQENYGSCRPGFIH